MNNEFNILMNLYSDLVNNIEHTKTHMCKIINLKDSITKMDSNYFDTKCNDQLFKQYLSMFEDVEMCNELFNNLETLKQYIEDKIENRCIHEWVNDSIDITPDSSKDICYCVKCEVTKK